MHVLAGVRRALPVVARAHYFTNQKNVSADAFKYESLPLVNGKICTLPFIDNTLQYFAYM